MNSPRTPRSPLVGGCRLTTPRDQVRALLFAPLPELDPSGFSPVQVAGLRALPTFCAQLKLIFGLRALEPLAERPPTATVDALSLTVELLAAVGSCIARNPDISMGSLLDAAILARGHLRPQPDEPGEAAQILLSPATLLLEAAELFPLRRARSAGTSDEVLDGAADLLIALWQFADQLRQSPGASPGELIHANGWASPATAKILFKLALGCAVGELVSEGRGRGVVRTLRASAAHHTCRPPERVSDPPDSRRY